MKKLHIILLEEPLKVGTPEDQLTVYVSRGGSINEMLMTMHLQGVLPKYKVMSHTVAPAYKTLLLMWFPRLGIIQKIYGKLNAWTWLKFFVGLPLKKLFKGSIRKNWQQIGEYDTVTRRIYPVADGEAINE